MSFHLEDSRLEHDMRYPIKAPSSHAGKVLEVDGEAETITLLGAAGEKIGTASLTEVADYIRACLEDQRVRHLRHYPRIPLSVKVKCVAADGTEFESLSEGIGGGGLFLERGDPLPTGSQVEVQFALPDRPTELLRAKGTVVWIRTKPERYTFFPGMGVQFTEISEDARHRLLETIRSLNHSRYTT
jgi:uncharacterized protein (TIGR02266 family)